MNALLTLAVLTLASLPPLQAQSQQGWTVEQPDQKADFPVGCLSVLPMEQATRDAGIKAVHHRKDPTGQPGFDGKTTPGVRLVHPEKPKTLIGLKGADGLIAAWDLDLGLGLNAKSPNWVGANQDGHVQLRAPKALSGAVVQVAGKDHNDKWLLEHLAFGPSALKNLEAFEHHYLRLRRANLTWPYDAQPPATLAAVEPIIAALIRFDLDGDGGADLLGFTVTRFIDEAGETMAETGELGVVWSQAGKTAGTVGFALEQGAMFPRFEIVPAALNNGRRLLYSAINCCDGISVRAFHLDEHRFEAVPPILRTGKYAACLRADVGPGTPFILRSLE